MGRRLVLAVCIILSIVVLSTCLFACHKTTTLVPEGRTTSSISLYYRADADAETKSYDLSFEEIVDMLSKLDECGVVEKDLLSAVSGAVLNEYFTYEIRVNIDRKGLKKAKTIYIYVGRVQSVANPLGGTIDNVSKDYIRMKDGDTYKGTATNDLLTYLGSLAKKTS